MIGLRLWLVVLACASSLAPARSAEDERFAPGPARVVLRTWRMPGYPTNDISTFGPRVVPRGATVVFFVPGYDKFGADQLGVRVAGGADQQLLLADRNGKFGTGAGEVEIIPGEGETRVLRFQARVPADAPLGWRTFEFSGKAPNGTDIQWTMDGAITVCVPMVFIVDIDGMRQELFHDAMTNAQTGCPTLRLLAGKRLSESPAGEKLERIDFEHAVALTEATTIFPTVTVVGHGSIFTGKDLRDFRMGGNQFFDRTIETKYGFSGYDRYDSASMARGQYVMWGEGTANTRALSVPGITTLYQDAHAQLEGMQSIVIHNMYHGDRAKKAASWDSYSALSSLAYFKTKTTHMADDALFATAKQRMHDYMTFGCARDKEKLGIMTLYVCGVDHLGHDGVDPQALRERQRKYMSEVVDPGLGSFCRYMPEAIFKNSHFVFIADHGQTDLNLYQQGGLDARIRCFAATRSMPNLHKFQDLLFEWGCVPEGKYFRGGKALDGYVLSSTLAGSVLGHNGGVAHVYLRRLKDPARRPPERTGWGMSPTMPPPIESEADYFAPWLQPPPRAYVLDIAERFWRWNETGWTPPGYTGEPEPSEYRHSLDFIMVRDTENARPGVDQDYGASRYAVYEGGGKTTPFEAWLDTPPGRKWVERMGWKNDARDRTFLVDRLERMNGPMSGDLLLVPFYPYFYTEPDPLQGDHGSFMRQDFIVPFVVARPGGEKADMDHVRNVLARSIDLSTKSRPATTDVKKTVLALLPPRSAPLEVSGVPRPVFVSRRAEGALGALFAEFRWAPFKDAKEGQSYLFRLEGGPSANGPFEKLAEHRLTSQFYGLQSDNAQYWEGKPEQITWRKEVSSMQHYDGTKPMWLRVVHIPRPGVEVASDAVGPDKAILELKYAGDLIGPVPEVRIQEHENDLWPGRYPGRSNPAQEVAPVAFVTAYIGSADRTFQPCDLPFEYTYLGKTWHAWTSEPRGGGDSALARMELPLRPGAQELEVRARIGDEQVSRKITIKYEPKYTPVVTGQQAVQTYVQPANDAMRAAFANPNNRDAKRFVTLLRDAIRQAVSRGYGLEGTYLWDSANMIYMQAFGRELPQVATDGNAVLFAKGDGKLEQMPAGLLSESMFFAGVAHWQAGELEKAIAIFARREALLSAWAPAGGEVHVPFRWFHADRSRALPLVAQYHAWLGKLPEAIRTWDAYLQAWTAVNPKPDNFSPIESYQYRPPDWYSRKNRNLPAVVAPPVVDGGRAIPGGLLGIGGGGSSGPGMPTGEGSGPPGNPGTVGGGNPGGWNPGGANPGDATTGGTVPGGPVAGGGGQGSPGGADGISQPLPLEQARALAREGKTPEALAQYDRALALAPQDEAVRGERGTLRLWNGDLRGARDDWAAIAQQSPANFDARRLAASLELVAGDARAGLAQAQELAKARPQDPLVLISLGQAQLWNNDSTGAQRTLQEAQRLAPAMSGQLYEQANQMLTAKVDQLARMQYLTVVWMDPNATHAYYGLGLASSRLGYKQQAIDALERYLTQDTSSQFAETARAELARLRAQ